jgi:predicted glutamine amidotransferase
MCGIAGYIGRSKKPKATFELITNLFDHLESRGTDASGLWGTEIGGDQIIYHKEPVRSSQFIKKDFWNQLKKLKMDMLLIHARAASKGGGNPGVNSNNHPFVSTDRRIGMVHNGTVDEAEFLKDKYQILSDTDSEFLLRMYEAGLENDYYTIDGVPDEVAWRVNAIKEIWSVISTGAMAVALGEMIDDHMRGLFLFRNEKRPIWLADLRHILGQVFFFSSPDIWYRAIAANDQLKKLCWGSQKLIELPPYQVWYMQIDKEDHTVTEENLFKLDVNVSTHGKDWQKGNYCEVKKNDIEVKVLTQMKEDELVEPVQAQIVPLGGIISKKQWGNSTRPQLREGFHFEEPFQSRNDHESLCEEISRLANTIYASATNMAMEGSMNPNDYQSLLESLEQTKHDLEGTLRILERS